MSSPSTPTTLPPEGSADGGPGRVDVLGLPYRCETIPLLPDAEGPVVASLVHRPAAGATSRGAVLHVHGYCDYFFQTEVADDWVSRGYDFYALDLRKYGRSLRGHQTPNYVTSLSEYWAELDAAWDRITGRDRHTEVVLSAHSTGGLTVPLWAAARRLPELSGVVLNSPWFDLQGPGVLRSAPASVLLDQLGRREPLRAFGRETPGLYGQSLLAGRSGEFSYDTAWKPLTSFPVRLGWLRAVRAGHARLHAGLGLRVPVLVLSSARSGHPRSLSDPDLHRTDVVLDVQQIRRWAPAVGDHVTSVAIEGARHDVFLSLPEVRAHAFDTVERWHRAWLD